MRRQHSRASGTNEQKFQTAHWSEFGKNLTQHLFPFLTLMGTLSFGNHFMEEDVFQRYSRYYDLLYRDKDYDAEADDVARTLRSADPTARKLLEIGFGTGRHGRLLARARFLCVWGRA